METAITKARRWGNSVGIILPAEMRRNLRIKPGQQLRVTVEQAENPLKELFGSLKTGKPTEEILREIRKNESKWM